jgi:large conductance mechanosensitive channel
MLKGFKEFILRGNVVDLAVGIVIGAAFTAVVNQLTDSFLNPIIKLVGGGGLDGGTFTVNDVVFDWAAFVNAVITFVITAAAIYFLVVAPMNLLNERRARGKEEDVPPTNEERMLALLEEIAANSRK